MLKSYKNILLIILAVIVVFAAGIVLMPMKEQVIDNGKNKELQERQYIEGIRDIRQVCRSCGP